MKYGMVLSLLAAFSASAAMAQGIPSQSKLNLLGLGSMNIVSDQAGEEVRGKAFFKIIGVWQAAAGEKAIVDVDTTVDPNVFTLNIDPANFVAHDFNSGALIVSDGRPLSTTGFSLTSPIGIQNQADAFHQQDVLIDGLIGFSEISSSINSFTTVIRAGAVMVPPRPGPF